MTDPAPMSDSGIDPADIAAIEAQLGRVPRGVHAIAHRCPCGNPTVVTTKPRLDDGTPFPTTFYLTCSNLSSRIGTIEASGIMAEMSDEVAANSELGAAYAKAHDAYLAARAEIEAEEGEVPEIAGISAGGMPTRVKCLHSLVGQSLAQGHGVNPIGDRTLAMLGEWWQPRPCVDGDAAEPDSGRGPDTFSES